MLLFGAINLIVTSKFVYGSDSLKSDTEPETVITSPASYDEESVSIVIIGTSEVCDAIGNWHDCFHHGQHRQNYSFVIV